MEQNLFTEEQRTEIKMLVHEALVEFFSTKGTLTKNIIVYIAIIIGSMAVIFGGIKWFLGLLGIGFVMK
jgi:hypothetical protein